MSYAIIECEKKKLFNRIDVDEVLNEVHIKLPFFKEKKSQKYAKKVCKHLKRHKVSFAVLSTELSNNEIFKNVLYMQNNYIITGNRLYVALVRKVMCNICELLDVPIETIFASILSHEFSIENLDLVKYISKSIKHLTVVSENKERFENTIGALLEDEGIVIEVLTNENCNISKSHFIINLDFTEDEMKKLILPKEAVVISIKENIASLRKNFSGVIINDISIYLNKKVENFRTLALSEAYTYDYKKKISENERLFERSEYKINGYIGNKGAIKEEELAKMGKMFTKKSRK